MFPGCDSDQADKRNVIYLTPVAAPFKDANRFKIYVKFAEQERSRSTTNLAGRKFEAHALASQTWWIKMFEERLKLDGQKVWGTRFGINYQFK